MVSVFYEVESLRAEMGRILSHLDARWSRAASAELVAQLREMIGVELSDRVHRVSIFASRNAGEPDITKIIEDPDIGSLCGVGQSYTDHIEGARLLPHWLVGGCDEVLLLPCLAVDKFGRAIGLPELGSVYRSARALQEKGTLLVGVAWSLQMVPELPQTPEAVSCDWICHERGFFSFVDPLAQDLLATGGVVGF